MLLSRLVLRPEALSPGQLERWFGTGYRVHQQLWRLFGDSPQRERDFLFREEYEGARLVVHTVSARAPSDPSRIWQIDPREYAPKLRPGDRLGFTVRVNPVRTLRDADGRQHRHDVVIHARKLMEEEGRPPTPVNEMALEVGLDWLQARAGQHGFEFRDEEVRVERYRQHTLTRPGRKSSTGSRADKPIRFSTLDFVGSLRVADPEPFVNMLFQGLGPAKGFGCGLMLVRRL